MGYFYWTDSGALYVLNSMSDYPRVSYTPVAELIKEGRAEFSTRTARAMGWPA